jgi:glutathione S-transferase
MDGKGGEDARMDQTASDSTTAAAGESFANDIIFFSSFDSPCDMKLIGSLASPFVRKVRIVMAEKKLDYEFVLEDVWSPATTISQSNPLGKVPCLVMEDGGAMFDSRVIVEYLDTMSPVGKLIPLGGRERASVKVWEALADGVAEAGILVRLERTQRPEDRQSEAWVARQLRKVSMGIASMAHALGEHPYCAGNHFSLADVAAGAALGWISFRFPEIDWRGEHENLARLFDKLSDRQSFRDTVPVA